MLKIVDTFGRSGLRPERHLGSSQCSLRPPAGGEEVTAVGLGPHKNPGDVLVWRTQNQYIVSGYSGVVKQGEGGGCSAVSSPPVSGESPAAV